MPREPKFSKYSARCKDIDLILPGLDGENHRAGRNQDRFRVSSETRDPKVFEQRKSMVLDLADRLLWPILRARLENRFSTTQLHAAYRDGKLEQLLASHSGHLLAPMLERYMMVTRARDREKTRMQIQRFIDYCGGGDRASTADVTTQKLASFCKSLRVERARQPRAVSNATQNRYSAAIGAFASFLIREALLTKHPKAFGALQKLDEGEHRMPSFSDDEYARYFALLEEAGPETRLFFQLLVHTGADVGEVETRRVSDCELSRQLPRIRYRRTKTRTPERLVPLAPALIPSLRQHIAEHELQRDDLLFGMLKRRRLEMAHDRVRRAMGRTDLRMKDFRHVAAIYWRKGGASIESVRAWLGHATILQTVVYTSFAPDDEHDEPAIRRASELLRGDAEKLKLVS
jgi:integrase